TEDAAQFVDLKVWGVTLTLADLMLRGILRGPDVDGLRWTDNDTQLAAHAPFHPIRVEGEPVPALEAWLDRGPFHLRVADGDGGAEQISECHRQSLHTSQRLSARASKDRHCHPP